LRIVYIGDSLGHVVCLLIYFRLAAMLMNILQCTSAARNPKFSAVEF
jgi:hypothetical protein